MAPRNHYTYLFKVGHKPIHGGITTNPPRREGEHQRELARNGHIYIVGNRKTEKGARQWEAENGW